jgi:tetratricopeptide (TPR) repeat protein
MGRSPVDSDRPTPDEPSPQRGRHISLASRFFGDIGRWWLVPGFLSGSLVAFFLAVCLLYLMTWVRYHPPLRAVAVATITATTPGDAQAIFERAEDALSSDGDIAGASDSLIALLPRLTDPVDLARAYSDLGSAEMAQGEFHRAAGYYLMLSQIEPTLDNLFALGLAYDQAGDLRHAVGTYEELTLRPDFVGSQYETIVKGRLESLYLVLGTPTPKAPPP